MHLPINLKSVFSMVATVNDGLFNLRIKRMSLIYDIRHVGFRIIMEISQVCLGEKIREDNFLLSAYHDISVFQNHVQVSTS